MTLRIEMNERGEAIEFGFETWLRPCLVANRCCGDDGRDGC